MSATPPCDCFYSLFSQPEIRSCIGSSRSASAVIVTTLGPDLEMWSSAYFYFRKGASRFMGRTFPSPYLTCLTCHYNKSCLVWRNYVEAAAELSQSSPCRGKSTMLWRHIMISRAGVTPGHYSAVTCYECRVTVVTLPTSVLHCRHDRNTKVPIYYIHNLDGYILPFPPL